MTSQHPDPIDDLLAQAFVYGDYQDATHHQYTAAKTTAENKSVDKPPESTLSMKLKTEAKEPTVRFTADLPQSIHRRLSILAARTGKKKVEIVRQLLVEALQNIEE